MRISISQPTLFPWLGYFDIIKKSDIFVFLDNVKFEKRNWQMRNRLKEVSKIDEGEVWIQVPTHKTESDIKIKDVKIDDKQNWKSKHIKTFQSLYGNAYHEIPFLKKLYDKEWKQLSDFNIFFITECCKFLGIDTYLKKASDLNVSGKKSELIFNICKQLNASEYLSTIGSKEYLEKDKEIFSKSNIHITYHEYNHPNYKQKGNQFMPQLSILDLLFNENENSKKYF